MSGLIEPSEKKRWYKSPDGKLINILFEQKTRESEEMKAMAESCGLTVGIVPIGRQSFYYINEVIHQRYFKHDVVWRLLSGGSKNPIFVFPAIDNADAMSIGELNQHFESVMRHATLKL